MYICIHVYLYVHRHGQGTPIGTGTGTGAAVRTGTGVFMRIGTVYVYVYSKWCVVQGNAHTARPGEPTQAEGMDIDLIELRSLKPLDIPTIKESLSRTHKIALLDESTHSGGVGATVSAMVSEQCFDLLDAPVRRLCMDDAPVPYAASMEVNVVKRGSDLVKAVYELVTKKA